MKRAIVWTVAGSDSGGGAGLQADGKAFDAWSVHGCSVVAAITAQNSQAVTQIEAVSPSLLQAQLSALMADMPPQAIKTGMLGSTENLYTLASCVESLRRQQPDLPLVVDTVLRATTGKALADDALLEAYRRVLIPRATVITPNRMEAAALLNQPVNTRAEVEQAAHTLRQWGAGAVVITGGDAADDYAQDFVSTPHAQGWLSLPRVSTTHHHGTGCVFASSVAAALAQGYVAIEAVVLAKMATTHALRHSYAAGQGSGPVWPRADFAHHIENLPYFHLPQPPQHAFAPLTQADMGLYAVVDSADWIERVLKAGVRCVQLRIKDPASPQLRDEIRRSVALAKAADAQLFINDHWQLALEEGAYGVHLGQEDLPHADLDALAKAGIRLGISTHSYWEVCRAWSIKPSYIACGPMYATQSKDMPWRPQGLDNLRYWAHLLPIPVVAIGGITPERAAQARAVGACGVAVISAITAATQVEAAIAQLQAKISAAVITASSNHLMKAQPSLSEPVQGS